jgi:class 3 adenylate cyclase
LASLYRMGEERRLVTVLFADVSGSTRLGESVDPEDLRALLGRFFAIAREVIDEHGGTLEKFIGDAVMAVFGIPQAHGDDAARAVGAALELRDRVRADPELGRRLPIRLGIHSGEVVASSQADAGDFLVTGDPVNTAARLQQAATEWQVLVSDRTASAAAPGYRFGPQRPVGARGKRASVAARELLGRSGSTTGRRLPLVDRRGDLDQLGLLARRTFEERRPHLVTVVAPAGTGKTRLAEEFIEVTLPQVQPGTRAVLAQCLPYGQALAYWPLRPLLLALADLAHLADGPPDAVIVGLSAWLAGLGDDSAERDSRLLAATIGCCEPDVTDRAALFAAWRTALELAATREPLAIVIDDLHWGSDSLLDLLEYVLAPHAQVPLLVVIVARPELLDRRPGWGGGRRNYAAIALEPLSIADVETLVGQLLPDAAPRTIRLVAERSEGNPFFATELARALREQAAGFGPVSVEAVLAHLPDTVQATTLARLDLLDRAPRRVLQLGAVLGRRFTREGLLALDPALEPDCDAAVATLVDRELVSGHPDGTLACRHVLIREVAYQTLPRAERADLHLAASLWLEEAHDGRGEDQAEPIAFHCREALALRTAAGQPPDADLLRRTIRWLRRAADVAARAAATPEASAHLRAALELAPPTDRAELHELLGDVLIAGDEAADAYAQALAGVRASGASANDELRLIGRTLGVYTRWQGSVGARPPEAELRRLVADGNRLLATADDPRAIATFETARGFLPYWLAAGGLAPPREVVRSSREGAEHALGLARDLDDPMLASASLDALSGVAQAIGDHRTALARARERLAMEERLNLPERLDAYQMVAWESCTLGEYREADRVSAAGVALLQPDQAPVAGLHLSAWRAFALAMLGEWDAALSAAAVGETIWESAGRTAAGYAAHGFLAALEICRARGDEGGVIHWRAILQVIGEQFARPSFALIPLDLARLDRDALEATLRAPVSLAERPHLLERVLNTYLDRDWPVPEVALRRLGGAAEEQGALPLRAQVLRADGRATGGESRLAEALELAERTGARPLAARLMIELGARTGSPASIARGADLLERLGDRDQLSRARSGLAPVPRDEPPVGAGRR